MLSKNRIISKAITATLICALTVTHSCHQETEQDRAKKVIIAVQQAAEGKDSKKFLNRISKSYNDPRGNDYDAIKGMLLGYFFRHQKINVYITNLDVTVKNGTARAVFQAVLTGANKTESVSDILTGALGMYAFEVSLKNEANEWLITSAQWERVGTGEGEHDR